MAVQGVLTQLAQPVIVFNALGPAQSLISLRVDVPVRARQTDQLRCRALTEAMTMTNKRPELTALEPSTIRADDLRRVRPLL
jgi:hypothetical protein